MSTFARSVALADSARARRRSNKRPARRSSATRPSRPTRPRAARPRRGATRRGAFLRRVLNEFYEPPRAPGAARTLVGCPSGVASPRRIPPCCPLARTTSSRPRRPRSRRYRPGQAVLACTGIDVIATSPSFLRWFPCGRPGRSSPRIGPRSRPCCRARLDCSSRRSLLCSPS